jgi:hypothetical protein
MKRALIVLVVLAIAAVVVAMIALVPMVRSGLSTHDEPTRMEATAARMVRHWAVPSELRDAKNPMPLTPEVLADGRAHFADHAPSVTATTAKAPAAWDERCPRTPDMTLAATQSQSDGELFAHRERRVPHRHAGLRCRHRGIGRGQLGARPLHPSPAKLTAEEMAEMEKLNPKSAAGGSRCRTRRSFSR